MCTPRVFCPARLGPVGLDQTVVKLVADPTTPKFQLLVDYEGPAGKINFVVEGRQSPTNPRTSAVVPLSVVKALKNLSSCVGIGI